MNLKYYCLLAILWSGSLQAQQKLRLNTDWQFLKQDLGGIWEAVRPVKQGNPEEVPLWSAVSLPHCVNARDAGLHFRRVNQHFIAHLEGAAGHTAGETAVVVEIA